MYNFSFFPLIIKKKNHYEKLKDQIKFEVVFSLNEKLQPGFPFKFAS